MKMEVKGSFWLIIVVVLSFGVTVVCGQNGLLSARCAARCLMEHRDSLRGGTDRNNHRKMLDRCKNYPLCFQCIKPCAMSMEEIEEEKCANYCRVNETECELSCHFLLRSYAFKPGSCPTPDTAVGFEAVCLKSCSIDGDCNDQRKCCPNKCGVACRQPVFNTHYHLLPPIPINLTFEEQRQGRSLIIHWSLPRDQRVPNGVLYVLEHRNTTSKKPSWNHNTPWMSLLLTKAHRAVIRGVHAGHWYQYRVAAVTEAGSQGYFTSSKSFKSSRDVQKPSPPQNLTEGATTLRKGQIDVTIHWQPPKYSDLPVWKYIVSWRYHLSKISPVLVRIDVLEEMVPGHQTEFKLQNLLPGTTYFIQIAAIMQYGNRRLRSKKSSMSLTTYSPPNPEPDNVDLTGEFAKLDDISTDSEIVSVISIYKDVIKVQRLRCSEPYFHQGVLKAVLSWKVGKAFVNIVKSYMIYWTPQSCDQDYTSLQPLSATSQTTRFEMYDLQFECQYIIRVNAVTKKGVQGKQASMRLRIPQCEKILVKGGSLPPVCPEREPNVPRSPDSVLPKIINNCTIDIDLSWDRPASDLKIEKYKIKYGIAEMFRSRGKGRSEPAYKEEPVVISLDNKFTNYTIKDLEELEHYMIQIFAHSKAGPGEPAYVDIWTPQILPCGSDKDPVPPDKTRTVTTINTTQIIPLDGSTVIVGMPSTVSKTTNSINSTTINIRSSKDKPASGNKLNIYKTVYYLFFIIHRLILG